MLINFVLYYYRNSTSVEMEEWQSDSKQAAGETQYPTWHFGPNIQCHLALSFSLCNFFRAVNITDVKDRSVGC